MRPLPLAARGISAVAIAALATACSDYRTPTAPEAPPTQTPIAATAVAAGPACSTYPRLRTVNVSTPTQLATAVANAMAGDAITLAPGTYRIPGSLKLYRSGTATNRVILCGPRTARLTTGSISYTAVWNYGRYWTLSGFTIDSARIGVFVSGGRYNRLEYLQIKNLGQEGVVVKNVAKYNTVRYNWIWNTGRLRRDWGEGIYLGYASVDWPGGVPDRSDSNSVLGNTFGPGMGAQAVDVKPGVTGTRVDSNTFDWTGASSYAVACVNLFGNRTTVRGNRGTCTKRYGFKVETLASGWGGYNVFHGNVIDITGSGTAGQGFHVGTGTAATSIVGCDDVVTGGKFANVSCK